MFLRMCKFMTLKPTQMIDQNMQMVEVTFDSLGF